jgi:hypothetical protein
VAAAAAAVIAALPAAAAALPRAPFQSRLAIPLRSMSEAAAVREPLVDRRAAAAEAAATAR